MNKVLEDWETIRSGLDGNRVAQAVRVLQRGGVVGYPSETVWGLAAWPASRAAVERLYTLKGREANKPVQLSCLDMQRARGWLRPGQDELEHLTVFWPGPLTVLAWATEGCPDWLAPGGVVGVRIPSHPVIQVLLAAAGGTLATTSLNPSGLPAASTREQAGGYALADLLLFPARVSSSAHLDNSGPGISGLGISGLASTVFDLRTRRVLRQGAISQAELLAALS